MKAAESQGKRKLIPVRIRLRPEQLATLDALATADARSRSAFIRARVKSQLTPSEGIIPSTQ